MEDPILFKKEYTRSDIKYLEEKYGYRFNRGFITAQKKGIKKIVFMPSNRVLWTVTGRSKTHILYGNNFCSCTDFYMSVVIKKKERYCYHQIALIIAMNQDLFEIEYHSDDEWIKYINLSKEYNLN